MKYIRIAISLMGLLFLFGGCEDFVQNIEDPIDRIDESKINEIGELDFLVTGIQQRFSTTWDRLAVMSDGLSDALIFDRGVSRATYPTFSQIDRGVILLDNNSIDGVFLDLGELLYFSDDIVNRATTLEAADPDSIDDDERDLLDEAYFTGYFYGGISRYFYAVYFGIDETTGGGVIDAGPFIPASDMFTQASSKLTAALDLASDYEAKVIHTLMAKIALNSGDNAGTLTHGDMGLESGDADFGSEHSSESTNYYWQHAGRGRWQWSVDPRFKAYVDSNAVEVSRIQIRQYRTTDIWGQDKYPNNDDFLPMLTWQENELNMAEAELRLGSGDPLARVNDVRASHAVETDTGDVELAPLGAVDLDVLYEERDKELFCTGNRLLDQRRYNKWHLDAGTWQYLPITDKERLSNPNID